jgi:hypothetical protein
MFYWELSSGGVLQAFEQTVIEDEKEEPKDETVSRSEQDKGLNDEEIVNVDNLNLDTFKLSSSRSPASTIISKNNSEDDYNDNASRRIFDEEKKLADSIGASFESQDSDNDARIRELKALRDKLRGSNNSIAGQLNDMIARRKALKSRPKQYNFGGGSPGAVQAKRYPSNNAFNQFQSEAVSAAGDEEGAELAPPVEEKIAQAKKEGRFTEKPSGFSSGGSGAGGKSSTKGRASAGGGKSSGGPRGSGVISGIAGEIYVPTEGEEKDNEFIDPLNDVVKGLLKPDQPHILAKVIPHALILNNKNGVQGLIETLGIEGRRFTTLEVYFAGDEKRPSYVVRIYDYDIGNNVVNDIPFRKRLVKTINVLKENNESTDQYMSEFYKESKYNKPNEILGSISSKLKLMYRRPACTNPDYNRRVPCVSPEEINELKGNVLTREEMVDLIEHDSSLGLAK